MALIMVLVYFVTLVAIGWFAKRRVAQSTDQFFVAGGTVGTFVNSWAFLATLASGGTIMAGVGMTLSLGLTYTIALAAGAPLGFALASILVARPMRRTGRYTVPDFFRARFDNVVLRWATPLVIVVGSTAFMVSQLTGSGIIATALLGWSHETGVIVTGLIFVFYVGLGGFLSVTWNDVFQGILMVVMTLVFALAVVFSVDSFPALFSETASEYPAFGVFGGALPVWSYIGGFVTSAVGICVLPHVIMRVYSARNSRSARLSLNYAMFFYAAIIVAVSLVLAPGATQLAGLEEMDPDAVFFALSDEVLPGFLQGLVAAAVLAAIMSTTAGLLMACNSAIGNDLYARLLRPGASQRQVVRVSAVATWVVGIVAIVFALDPPEFLVVLYVAAGGFVAASFFAPVLLGIWWRRCTSYGAAAGLIAGAGTFGIAYYAFDLPASSEILVAIPASFVVTMLVSLLGPASTTEETEVADRAHAAADAS